VFHRIQTYSKRSRLRIIMVDHLVIYLRKSIVDIHNDILLTNLIKL